jgi:hypothetical protein
VDSVNPDMWAQIQAQNSTLVTPQRNFYDGTISNSEWSVDLDVNKDFEVGLSKPITFAFGGQYRDAYGIGSGEFGSYYSGGAQSYPGFSPSDAGVNVRRAEAAYVDFAIDPIKNLHLDLAGRYEHYSDFGSVYTGKVTARYDFSPAFALRGTVSNGFRAPTLAEEFYSSVNVGPGFVAGQFPPNSSAASALGFNKLQPEKSTNFSVGFVAHPAPKLQITRRLRDPPAQADQPSATIFGYDSSYTHNNGVVSQAVLDALHARGISTSMRRPMRASTSLPTVPTPAPAVSRRLSTTLRTSVRRARSTGASASTTTDQAAAHLSAARAGHQHARLQPVAAARPQCADRPHHGNAAREDDLQRFVDHGSPLGELPRNDLRFDQPAVSTAAAVMATVRPFCGSVRPASPTSTSVTR